MKCSKITARGQCNRVATEGSNYCTLHAKNEDLITAYKLADPKLNEAVRHHARASLADISHQVVLLRAIVQRRLNMAGDDEASQIAAMNFAAGRLADITKMTESMVKLARESGDLMSRVEVEEFVDGVVRIVSEELNDVPDSNAVVDRIESRIKEELSD